MAYDPSIVAEIRRRAAKVKDPGKRNRYIRAAFQTGIVESGLRNLRYGDADSEGWRQERKSLYKDPTNVTASVDRFFNELEQLDRGQPSWELAADVQRPAAQYRGRYKQVAGEADKLAAGGVPGSEEDDGARYRTVSKTTPGIDNRRERAALIMNFLGSKGGDPLDFAQRAVQLRDVAPVTTESRVRIPGSGGGASAGGGGGGLASFAKQRADVIDRQRLPYSWGGGHAGQTPITKAVPLDCSGAVSKVLGIDPRVSGQFEKWGRPGDGGDKGVTVYANDHHVLMKINGHFFGTSADNPGGGAGWIEQEKISPEYLSGFTARHSAR